jgi:PAS domain S-box-containing protein
VLNRLKALQSGSPPDVPSELGSLSLLDACPGAAALLNQDGVVTAVNSEWAEFSHSAHAIRTGVVPGESYLAACDRAAELGYYGAAGMARGLRAMLNGQQREVRQTARCDSADAERRYEGIARAVVSDGECVGALVTHVEVKDLAMVAARTGEPVLITDAAGRTEWCNAAFERMCGHTLAELEGQKPGEVLHGPATDPKAVERLRHAVATGTGTRVELANYGRAGWPYLARIDLVPLHDGESEQPSRFVAFERDVTAERQEAALDTARQAVLAEMARGTDLRGVLDVLAATVETAVCGARAVVALREAETQIDRVAAAPSAGELFGHPLPVKPQAGCCGASRGRMVADADEDLNAAPEQAAILTALGIQACWRQPIQAAEGTVLGIFAFLFDTSRTASEAETTFLDRASAIAESVVAQKYLEAELREAREAAEHASRAKSTFLANMSHEIRTPLNAIIGYAEMLEQELFGPLGDARYAEYARDIRTSGQHLHELLGQVLDLAKIESPSHALEPATVTLAEVVGEAVTMLGRPAVAVRCDPGMRVKTDARAIRQVLLNVIGNAVKHAESVTVAGEARGEWVALQVHDDGPGIPEEKLDRVTQPFYTSDAHTRVEGTGIGLALSKQLMEALGGELRITSTVGTGTTVSLHLPETIGAAEGW